MLPSEFEPAISASERPQTHHAAKGVDYYLFIYLFIHSFIHVYTVSTGLETGFRPQHYHKWTLGLLPAKYNVIIQYGVLTQFRAFSYKFLTQGAPYLGYHKYLNRGIKSANT